MARFLVGSVKHSLDEKGRVRIPAKFREVLCGTLCVMPSLNGSLFLLPAGKSEPELERIASMELYDRDKQESATLVLSHSDYIDVDGQGRILLSAEHRKILNNKKDLVFVGKATYAEIWPEDVWTERFTLLNPENLDAVLEKMKQYGI
jgi:MraZ protein